MASDNCDDDVTVSYADTTVAGTGNNSVITRVWTATDDNSIQLLILKQYSSRYYRPVADVANLADVTAECGRGINCFTATTIVVIQSME